MNRINIFPTNFPQQPNEFWKPLEGGNPLKVNLQNRIKARNERAAAAVAAAAPAAPAERAGRSIGKKS